ncbi:hypothetical protein [Burkholderia cenocepacia]|uniref:hypothetical protein n=1 Tax=Burkholderia cenocepacia TaxID=95486 RepID=UPI00158C267B|nr:hypothetical protein [Burkholderia cenocepacia]
MSDTTSTTLELTPQQVAADLFRIGENPNLPAWHYPVLRRAIELLSNQVFASRLAAAPIDPCPHCVPGAVCKTMTCGRLAAMQRPTPGAGSRTAADGFTYASKQATLCAVCGAHKHTPLRIDRMGGYVCLTCIDHELERSMTLADGQRAAVEFALGMCAGHVAGERHVQALESLLSVAQEAR